MRNFESISEVDILKGSGNKKEIPMYSILHLETSSMFKKIISDICAELSIEYHHCASSIEAFDLMGKAKISLIITAMELEDENAEKFIQSLNESAHNAIPIVVITGNDTYEDRQKMYNFGIVDYIVKKSKIDEIKQNILSYKNDSEILQKMDTLKYAICDDHQTDRKIIERIFGLYNIKNFDIYESGEDLLNSKRKYDVYLVDLLMKNLSGQDIVHRLRNNGCDGVIIVISGVDNVKTISKVLAIGADDYIIKPYNNEIFISRLKINIRSYLLVKEVKEKSLQLERAAITDGLTGLYNHKHIFDLLDNEIAKQLITKTELSIIMFDIDFFKKMNDNFGHQFGDVVLKKVADIIKKSIRTTDVAGRYGGEEFMVILPGANLDCSVKIAEKIRRSVESIKCPNKENFFSSISGGVRFYEGETAKEFVKKADDLLYKAKHGGRNRVEVSQ